MTEHDEQAEVVWPEPRDDPDQEPSHHAARIADRDRGIELGDEEEAGDGADP